MSLVSGEKTNFQFVSLSPRAHALLLLPLFLLPAAAARRLPPFSTALENRLPAPRVACDDATMTGLEASGNMDQID